MKSMIYEENLVYDDRTSLSYDLDESAASYMQKKPKKMNLDDEDRKFLLVYQAVMQCFLHLIPRML